MPFGIPESLHPAHCRCGEALRQVMASLLPKSAFSYREISGRKYCLS